MAITCCKDCRPPRRKANCHSRCPDYILEKAFHDVEAEENRKQQNTADGLNDQKHSAIHRAAKRLATSKTKGSANG